MPDSKAYHVSLNGKGYILVDGSRIRRAQPPMWPRFSTGDYGLTDLSFWQFLSQEDFSGGEGQEIYSDKTKYLESCGWDIRDGKPRLSFPAQDANVNALTTTPAKSSNVPSQMYEYNASLAVIVENTGTNDATNNNSPGGNGGYVPLG